MKTIQKHFISVQENFNTDDAIVAPEITSLKEFSNKAIYFSDDILLNSSQLN